MRTIGKLIFIFLCMASFAAGKVYAQYIPLVYDRVYGNAHVYNSAVTFSNGDVVIAGKSGSNAVVTWIGRDGAINFSKIFTDGFSTINRIQCMGESSVMVIGSGESVSVKGSNKPVIGRAVIINKKGEVTMNCSVGDPGTVLTCGKELRDGNYIFGGYEVHGNGLRKGVLIRSTPRGKQFYKYIPTEGAECFDFEVMGGASGFVVASFSGSENGFGSVVRLDENGKPFFITLIKHEDFRITNFKTDFDGSIFITGGSPAAGGQLLKVRPEGAIVFAKQIVPASEGAIVSHLHINKEGNLLVGGNGGNYGYYALLRNDGTELFSNLIQGAIQSMGVNEQNGEAVIAGFNPSLRQGIAIKLSSAGKRMFENNLIGSYDLVKINPLGEALMADVKTGRLTMLSNYGEVLFDRLIRDDKPQAFERVYFSENGDVVFAGDKNRVVKLAHGLYVSDVIINKPVNGFTTASFTVTLTGYSTSETGVPVPVVVDYKTFEGTAKTGRHFDLAEGSLSFVPANDGAERYMVKQTVEVPIWANNYVEGRKKFEMILGNVANSYLVKPAGECIIEDQQALLRFIGSKDGYKNGDDVVMEVGLFKSNGVPLINDTGADIVLSGAYGKGTADASNFDMGRIPRLIIENKNGTGKFNVKTLQNTRYELPKTVVVDFNDINSMSESNVSFESSLLSCTGRIIDEPAVLVITSLGDHGRRNNNVSGLFKISLQRASDGTLLTNATGNDIEVSCEIDSSSSASQGHDFVLTNQYDLRIWGDGNRSAVNLDGIVLFNPDASPRTVKVNLTNVKFPADAPKVTISPEAGSANFNIK